MLSDSTKLRLVHAVTDQRTADEIEARITVDSTPSTEQEGQDLLATLDERRDAAIRERLPIALAGDAQGAGGRELAQKVTSMLQVVKALADGADVEAVAAEFEGQVGGMATDVTITADEAGEAGNSILLEFDGIKNINDAITDWNTANPANTASLTEGDGSQVPNDQEGIQLSGGAEAEYTTLEAAKEAMGDEYMSDSAFELLVHAVTDRLAAEEIRAAYNTMVDTIQAVDPS